MSPRHASYGMSSSHTGSAIRASAAYLYTQLGLPTETVIRLAGTVDLVLYPRLVDRESIAGTWNGSRHGNEVVGLECGDQTGALVFEGGLAPGLVNRVLGLAWPPCFGRLSRLDRGVLEGALAIMLDRLGLAPAIRLRGEGIELAPPGSLAIALAVRLGNDTGRAWLLATDEFLLRFWSLLVPSRDWREAWLELADTRIPRLGMAGLEVGDIVVFDETSSLPATGAWTVRLRWRENVVIAQWLADGSLAANEGDATSSKGDATTKSERRLSAEARKQGSNETSMVRVGLGLALPGVDAVGLAPLLLRRDAPLIVSADDQPRAFGALTQFEGSLAVAITRKLAG